EAKEVLVIVAGAKRSGSCGFAQRRVFGMLEETVGKIADGALDGAAETVADARAGFERVLMINLDPTLFGSIVGQRQARGVKQAVEESEIGEEAVREDAVEVEFEIAEFDEAGAVAEEAENAAV